MAQDISGIAPYDFPLFFFDANVWIAILKNTKSVPVETYETPYITLLEGIMKVMSNKYDFNDYFYYHFCKKHKIPVVTHDKDFKFNDIEVFTKNKALLS